MELLLEQSIAQVERALLDAITLALRIRASVADLDALRTRSTRSAGGGPARSDRDLVYVASVGNVYGWVQASTAADDGDITIKPADGGATGRWVKATSSVRLAGVSIATLPAGYLKVVVLHNGDFSDEVLCARIYGQSLCVAIHFAGESRTPPSQSPARSTATRCASSFGPSRATIDASFPMSPIVNVHQIGVLGNLVSPSS